MTGAESVQRIEDLINRQIETPYEESEKAEPPRFLTHIKDLNKVEGDSAHFECRLEPIGDPSLTIEWFLNDKPLVTG